MVPCTPAGHLSTAELMAQTRITPQDLKRALLSLCHHNPKLNPPLLLKGQAASEDTAEAAYIINKGAPVYPDVHPPPPPRVNEWRMF